MQAPQPCLDDDDNEFQPPKSVWAELKAKLVPAEVQETVNILGQSQIDRNHDLHDELGTMLDILRDYTAEVDGKAQKWRAHFSRDTNRDMLTTEIRSFISALRSKTSTPISLRPSTPHDRSVLGYVLPENETEGLLREPSRQLLASRGGNRGGMPGSVGSNTRPGTAEAAGRLAREIAAREGGGDGDNCKLSLESMEMEAQRFQQVLKEEEQELKAHIEFMHEVLEAEHERGGLHSDVPTTNDLKDLRDKLQTELSFAAAENRISKGVGGGSRLTPLAPLGQSSSANLLGAPLLSPLSLSRGATPLCHAPIPSSFRPGFGGMTDDGRLTLLTSEFCRPDSSRILPASAGSVSSCAGSVGGGLYIDGASSRPLSRCAAAIGLDLDSDEDDFLFGGSDEEELGVRPRSKSSRGAEVLVLDDDEHDVPLPAQRVKNPKKKSSTTVSGALTGQGSVSSVDGALARAAGGKVPVVDTELHEQSKALRDLLSGLVNRDNLADPERAIHDDVSWSGMAACADIDHAAIGVVHSMSGVSPASGGRRVSLGRHRTLIQQARGASIDGEDAVEAAAATPAARSSSATDLSSSNSSMRMRVTSSSSASSNRPPLRAPQHPANNSAGVERLAMGARGLSRGLASAPAGSAVSHERGRGGLGVSGVGFVHGSPPTPPTAPRRTTGSAAGERLRPIYARPSASISSVNKRNEV